MDLWVAAAVAGAGYLANYLNNAKQRRGSSDSDTSFKNSDASESNFVSSPSRDLEKKRVKLGRVNSIEKSSSLRWVDRKSEKHSTNVEEDKTFLTSSSADAFCSPRNERVLVSGANSEMHTDLLGDENHPLSLSNGSPAFAREEHLQEDNGEVREIDKFLDDSSCEKHDLANLLQVSSGFRFRSGRSSLKGKFYHDSSEQPLNSLQSCAVAHFCQECGEAKETDFGPFPLLTRPIFQPHFLSNNLTSRNLKSWMDSLNLDSDNGEQELRTGEQFESSVKDALNGFLPPFEMGLVELQRKSKRRRAKRRHQPSQMSKIHQTGEHFNLQGPRDEVLLFCLGIGIGSVFTLRSRKIERDKLNSLLKHTQNLAQDLHEELELHDSLTVKELEGEQPQFQECSSSSSYIGEEISFNPRQSSASIFPIHDSPKSSERDNEETKILEHDYSKPLTQIEAELAAELATLELNINSGLENRTPDFDELDIEFTVVHGELKTNGINEGFDFDQNACSTSTPHVDLAKYAVSPRELSLRLHELLQSRLEERISELECALEDTQKNLHFMETEQLSSQSGFSSSGIESFSAHENPFMTAYHKTSSPPAFLNPPHDALNSCNESYQELTKKNDQLVQDNLSKDVNGKEASPLNQVTTEGWDISGDLSVARKKSCEITESDDDDDHDHDDEFAKLLIKRIVEKSRQGSPLVRNAQRLLLSMDD